jgi:hypothetical protein
MLSVANYKLPAPSAGFVRAQAKILALTGKTGLNFDSSLNICMPAKFGLVRSIDE